MKAYKVFDSDWKCRDFQYEVGKTYTHKGDIELCGSGFHACEKLIDCFNYYSFNPENKVAVVELSGKIEHGGDKSVCSKIKIIKELTWEEVLRKVNIGKGNTGYRNSGNSNSGNSNSGNSNSGYRNSGNSNSGDWNSGNSNSGDWNSGYRNSGDRNSGNRNSGNRNSGDWNSGYRNSGDRNSGNRNSGNRNSGDSNSGYRNSGNSNSGYRNSGDSNSGDSNSGYRNSGDRNSGDWNSGDSNSGYGNSGDRNSGDWNSGYRNSGYFNTDEPRTVRVFNKDVDKRVWDDSTKPNFLYDVTLTEWVSFDDMTDDEKKNDKDAYIRGGYLKSYTYEEAWKNAYNKASKRDIELLKALPNFDAEIFKEITGIEVE